MKSVDIRNKYLEFFKKKNHKIIPGSSILPENDPTVLFTTAGMHPLVPYLLGQPHPLGNKLTDYQKCIRTGDIDEVGDSFHLTFFEMLGNWSLNDYWKKDSVGMSFEFLTKILKIPVKKIAVTCFKGDKDAPKDTESSKIWESLGIPKERIAFLPKKDNWWGPVGSTGPCGPDTEMFIWSSSKKPPKKFDPKDITWIEIWNNVFIEYTKTTEGKYLPIKQRNIDTGFGLERAAMILQEKPSVFETDLFLPIKKKLNKDETYVRIILDHVRSALFILVEGIKPSNLEQGYVLRRLIRRSIRYSKLLNLPEDYLINLSKDFIKLYEKLYPELTENKELILTELEQEKKKFENTLKQGLRIFERETSKLKSKTIPGKLAFILFSSYGFPLELTKDLAKEHKLKVNEKEFKKEFEEHQKLSRKGSEKKFKGGLVDHSKIVTKLHTATHLLHQALRMVLGSHVQQKGSNITPERLRFDFSHDKALTKEEIAKAEKIVNEKIKQGLEVNVKEMKYEDAIKQGVLAFFKERYPEKVTVYSIGNFSKEICIGPHVKNTKELKNFKIKKEESVAAGVRRIKALVDYK
ncbi:alanine--tRNA ligase [archaeon]|nr:alanine--tRNA ligase [archaeon]